MSETRTSVYYALNKMVMISLFLIYSSLQNQEKPDPVPLFWGQMLVIVT